MKAIVRFARLAIILPFAAAVIADTPEADEYALKAAMVANVVRLVDWPAGKTADPMAPLTICVFNSDEMETALAKATAKAPAAGSRRLAIKRGSSWGTDQCDAVFFGGSDRKRIEPVLRATGAQPVLTLGECDRFTAWGGMVGLLIHEDHLQVEVNLRVSQASGLTVSSRLLKIAVIRGGGPN